MEVVSPDMVVSCWHLARAKDPVVAARSIAAALGSAGEVVFVEPVCRPGWIGGLRARIDRALASRIGYHGDRDVPALLRAAGLTIVDIERFTMSTRLGPRLVVSGRAVPTPEYPT